MNPLHPQRHGSTGKMGLFSGKSGCRFSVRENQVGLDNNRHVARENWVVAWQPATSAHVVPVRNWRPATSAHVVPTWCQCVTLAAGAPAMEPDTEGWEDPERISSDQAAAAARQVHASTGVLLEFLLQAMGRGSAPGVATPRATAHVARSTAPPSSSRTPRPEPLRDDDGGKAGDGGQGAARPVHNASHHAVSGVATFHVPTPSAARTLFASPPITSHRSTPPTFDQHLPHAVSLPHPPHAQSPPNTGTPVHTARTPGSTARGMMIHSEGQRRRFVWKPIFVVRSPPRCP